MLHTHFCFLVLFLFFIKPSNDLSGRYHQLYLTSKETEVHISKMRELKIYQCQDSVLDLITPEPRLWNINLLSFSTPLHVTDRQRSFREVVKEDKGSARHLHA